VVIADAFDWQMVLERFGLPMLGLVVVLYTGYKQVWVWGYQLKEAKQREADWKDMALRGTLIAERATGRDKWTIEQRLEFLEKATKDVGDERQPG
jgi:hypothetical protein